MESDTNNNSKLQSNKEDTIQKQAIVTKNTNEVCQPLNKLYSKKCGNNKSQLEIELENREELAEHPNEDQFLYPILDDPNFNIKIAQKKEFSDTKYDGTIYDVEEYAKVLSSAEYELLPQQAFVRNFMSFQTPYNSLLLFHGLGSGKTCSAIGVCEEMRDYLRQMGINKRIIVVASPNVQDNFKLQLFDERKLKLIDGIWTMKGCLGNKLLKEINPTGMKGLKREKVIQQVTSLINSSYSFQGYLQFSNEIVRKSGSLNDKMETKIRNLQHEYSDRLIVIDEVHNIRISDDNENKNVAKNLMFLVSMVSNLRLLLLSATPMFNSYEEIVWLLNLMNMNDRRGIVAVSDIFDKDGGFKKDSDGKEIGKEMLIRKATGYVSYVRGENPYTFPFRVYPNRFDLEHTIQTPAEYPNYQINGRKIPKAKKIEKLSLYLTVIGEYQQLGYSYIIDRLRNRGEQTKTNRLGRSRTTPAFSALKAFGYTDLQIPIEALNIIYPYNGLEELVQRIAPIEFINDEEDEIDDISPTSIKEQKMIEEGNEKEVGDQDQDQDQNQKKEKEIVEEIDDIMNSGPAFDPNVKEQLTKSELESEPAITEGVEADDQFLENPQIELDEEKNELPHLKSVPIYHEPLKPQNNIIDLIDQDIEFKSKPAVAPILEKKEEEKEEKEEKEEQEKEEKPKQKTKKGKKKTKSEIEFEILNKDGEIEELKKELDECKSTLGQIKKEEQQGRKNDDEFLIPKPSVKISSSKNIKSVSSLTKKQPINPLETLEPLDASEGTHIVEGLTQSQYPSQKNPVKENIDESYSGGADSESVTEYLDIDPKELTGSHGLKRIMSYIDSKTPSLKGQFEYKKDVPHIFKGTEIGKYSAKIKTICNYIYNNETDKLSDGIILIYSSYIDAGIIPMALALEEMGFTRYGEKAKPLFKELPTPVVDIRTMKPPTNKKNFKPARYIMITGDPRISPNNDADVKAITSNDNIYEEDKDGNITDISGQKIKVVLISQAGSEGLDFKAIRQVHILEPWYNVNRIEQIIGRAVRNFSHKDLPFSKRNVQIFLYGTILANADEEAADLYIYRISEFKAVKIGKVTRLLKQTAVDCVINHDQTKFISENFNEIEENRDIYQILSDHQRLDNFVIGDLDNSVTCDFMECKFSCLPDIPEEDMKPNTDTYNEAFMIVNSDKIIQKIKTLMKMRYFYKKNDLIQLINVPKKYPLSQIYASLTQIINDNTEYIYDKYGRTGYLINIGDYYLFQPSELNYKNISVFDRSVPIDYKHNSINFEIKSKLAKPVISRNAMDDELTGKDTGKENEEDIQKHKETILKGQNVFETMFSNYVLTLSTLTVEKDKKNWYQYCGLVIRKMSKENEIIPADTEHKRLEFLEQFLIEHIVDSLMMYEKVDLLNFIYNSKEELANERMKRFSGKVKKYLLSKLIVSKGITALVMFDGPSRVDNLNIYVLDGKQWVPASAEDKRDLGDAILKKYRLKNNLNHYVGFIGFETNKKYMVYKVKDTENERSTGFRCDQSGKEKIIKILNDIEADEKYVSKVTKDGAFELCIRQEFTLRSFENQRLKNRTWFLDTETAIINEFEKKEKGKK